MSGSPPKSGRTMRRHTAVEPIGRTTTSKPQEVLRGIRVPEDIDTVHGVNYMLTQIPGKLRLEDIKQAVQKQQQEHEEQEKQVTLGSGVPTVHAGAKGRVTHKGEHKFDYSSAPDTDMSFSGSTRQMREMIFNRHVVDYKDHEKSLEINPTKPRIGHQVMSEEQRADLEDQRYRSFLESERATRDADRERYTTAVEKTRVWHLALTAAGATPPTVAAPSSSSSSTDFSSDAWEFRRQTLERFIGSVTKLLVRQRVDRRLAILKAKAATTASAASSSSSSSSSSSKSVARSPTRRSGSASSDRSSASSLSPSPLASPLAAAATLRATMTGKAAVPVVTASVIPASTSTASPAAAAAGSSAPKSRFRLTTQSVRGWAFPVADTRRNAHDGSVAASAWPDFLHWEPVPLKTALEYKVLGHTEARVESVPMYQPLEAARPLRTGALDEYITKVDLPPASSPAEPPTQTITASVKLPTTSSSTSPAGTESSSPITTTPSSSSSSDSSLLPAHVTAPLPTQPLETLRSSSEVGSYCKLIPRSETDPLYAFRPALISGSDFRYYYREESVASEARSSIANLPHVSQFWRPHREASLRTDWASYGWEGDFALPIPPLLTSQPPEDVISDPAKEADGSDLPFRATVPTMQAARSLFEQVPTGSGVAPPSSAEKEGGGGVSDTAREKKAPAGKKDASSAAAAAAANKATAALHPYRAIPTLDRSKAAELVDQLIANQRQTATHELSTLLRAFNQTVTRPANLVPLLTVEKRS